MKAELRIVLSADEVDKCIPYKVLVEIWDRLNTFSGKRALTQAGLTKRQLTPLHEKANDWYLRTGLPQNEYFTPEEIELWGRVSEMLSLL